MGKALKILAGILLVVAAVAVYTLNSGGGGSLPWGAAKQKKYAGTLVERGLYRQAVEEYEKLRDNGGLKPSEAANVSYVIGDIYREHLRDYEQALAAYLKVKVFDGHTKLEDALNRKIIECLERTGRSFEARKEMDRHTLLKQKEEIPQGQVVAKLGNRKITMQELEQQIKNLPPYIQKEYSGRDKQLEFLTQYVATELLYDAAKRMGYENDSGIAEQAAQMKKSLMVAKYMQEKLEDKLDVTASEIKLYYEAHNDDFKGKTLDESRGDIYKELRAEKEKEAQQELITKLFSAERAEIYDRLFTAGPANRNDETE